MTLRDFCQHIPLQALLPKHHLIRVTMHSGTRKRDKEEQVTSGTEVEDTSPAGVHMASIDTCSSIQQSIRYRYV